jgi:hypothetical protein
LIDAGHLKHNLNALRATRTMKKARFGEAGFAVQT